MLVLQPQQIRASDSQQQAISRLNAAIRKRRKDAFSSPLQFQHINIEPTLQAAVPEGLPHQAGRGWDRDFREVSSQGLVGAELIVRTSAIG